jgi:iron complex outermembrane recepter protein
VYARLASGYRPGGPNGTCTPNFPCQYSADKTKNYEVGVKGDVLGHALSFDASAYYVDWDDVQLSLVDPSAGVGYIDNGGHARSRGVELSVESRPLTGLTLSGWAAWNDAELTEVPGASSVVATSGDRLPYSSPISGNLSLDQEFPLGRSTTGFVGGSVSYVDDRRGVFPSISVPSATRQVFSSYTQTDLRAGLRYASWTLSAFANNVTDKRGVLTGGLDRPVTTYAFNYIQPRTVGAFLSKTF